MVLGYDEARPSERDYFQVAERLRRGLEIFGDKRISLIQHGSFARNEAVYGESDIDYVLIFPDEFIIDKERFSKVSQIFCNAIGKTNVPLQVSIHDSGNNRDGRFNSFGIDWEDYLKERGALLFGADYRNEMNYLGQKPSAMHTAADKLRRTREGLLFFDSYKGSELREKFHKSAKGITTGLKQILTCIDGRVREHRFSTIEELANEFPSLDLTSLEKLKSIMQNPEELDKIYRDSEKMRELWNENLTIFEGAVKSYVEKYPQ